MTTETTAAQAELLAATPEMLRELDAAHQILGLTFNLLNDQQKAELARLVNLRELTGDESSSTRYWERRDILAKARLLVREAIPAPVEQPEDDEEDRIPF